MEASLPMPGHRHGRSGCSSALPYPPCRRNDCALSWRECKSSSRLMSFEQVIDVEILEYETLGTTENACNLKRRHLLTSAVTDALEHAQIVVHSME